MLADVAEVEGLEVAEMHGVEQHQYRLIGHFSYIELTLWNSLGYLKVRLERRDLGFKPIPFDIY